ncbi:MAG: FAD-dependent oxidoreductase [Clostridia bacterium]|nr:FAD-dependent oxidoreductase [Clostridia bacterium]
MNNSYWIHSINLKSFPKLEKDLEVTVAIIGGGITGLSTAYYLSQNGYDVCILEKDKLAHHATGNTTAKVTSQHDLFYDYLIHTFGKSFAKSYLDANEEAIKNIKEIIDTEKIDCDFEWQDAYVYTDLEDEVIKIKNEVTSVNSLDFPAEFVTDSSLPFPIKACIKFPNQAQFHPLKYVKGLSDCIVQNGGQIYENTKVYDIDKKDDFYEIRTDNHTIHAKYVVLACHYPIVNTPGFYFLKMYQETSYLIGFTTDSKLFDGMYINTKSPICSLRTVPYKEDKRLVLMGGSEHKTGVKEDLSDCYLNLENRAKELFPDANVLYRWNTEDCISLDKIPYIGEFSQMMPHMYIATGFKKWGMTTSNIAANIITDMIMGKENPYAETFKSTRFNPVKNGTEFVDMLKQTTTSLVLDKFKIPKDTLGSINKDEGKIVEVENTKLGIYRDTEGKYFCLKPICSHLGCELSWNNLDKTWDCPCHGSRFSYTGKSLYDPSIKDIELINID